MLWPNQYTCSNEHGDINTHTHTHTYIYIERERERQMQECLGFIATHNMKMATSTHTWKRLGFKATHTHTQVRVLLLWPQGKDSNWIWNKIYHKSHMNMKKKLLRIFISFHGIVHSKFQPNHSYFFHYTYQQLSFHRQKEGIQTWNSPPPSND